MARSLRGVEKLGTAITCDAGVGAGAGAARGARVSAFTVELKCTAAVDHVV